MDKQQQTSKELAGVLAVIERLFEIDDQHYWSKVPNADRVLFLDYFNYQLRRRCEELQTTHNSSVILATQIKCLKDMIEESVKSARELLEKHGKNDERSEQKSYESLVDAVKYQKRIHGNTEQVYDSLIEPLVQWRRERFPVIRSVKVSDQLRKQVMERDAYRCQKCGGWVDLQVDHVYPASKGGPTVPDNLQTLCLPCNSRKGATI